MNRDIEGAASLQVLCCAHSDAIFGLYFTLKRRTCPCPQDGQPRQAQVGPAKARRYLYDLSDYIFEI